MIADPTVAELVCILGQIIIDTDGLALTDKALAYLDAHALADVASGPEAA
jgi:hypothetical protein